MEVTTTKTKDWKKVGDNIYETPEGVKFESKELKRVCDYYGVPGTLLNVDKKFGTETFAEVAKVHAPVVKYVIRDEKVQVLDPRSTLMTDEEFDKAIEVATTISGITPNLSNKEKAVFELPAIDSDSFLGDVFSRSFSIERLPQGGVNLATNLLRLVCTNGMIIPDTQYRSLIRSANVDKPVLGAFWDAVGNFSVDKYFDSLFTHNGLPVAASVADYFGMHDTLNRIADEDIANLLLPKEPISEFYASQGIELSKIARMSLNRLPSGIDYYQCFNILINGAKNAEKTLENELKVADWCRPSRLTQMKASYFSFKGMPQFDTSVIKSRMGDVV